MVPKSIGTEMRQRRLDLGLRQADVAQAIGVTRAYVSAVERGVDWDPDADKLVLWAAALDLPDDHWISRMPPRRVLDVDLPPVVLDQIRMTVARAFVEEVLAHRDELVAALTRPDDAPRTLPEGPRRRPESAEGSRSLPMDTLPTAPNSLVATLARIVRAVEAHERASANPSTADDRDEDPAE